MNARVTTGWICLLVAACGGSDELAGSNGSDRDGAAVGPDGGQDPGVPTWHGGVGTLQMRECGSCHVDGSAAPFTMTYEDAKDWKDNIKAETVARRMPPMPVNNDGSCNTFSNARWLTDDEIAEIVAWVDGGAQLGDTNLVVPGVVVNNIDIDADFELWVKWLGDFDATQLKIAPEILAAAQKAVAEAAR